MTKRAGVSSVKAAQNSFKRSYLAMNKALLFNGVRAMAMNNKFVMGFSNKYEDSQ